MHRAARGHASLDAASAAAAGPSAGCSRRVAVGTGAKASCRRAPRPASRPRHRHLPGLIAVCSALQQLALWHVCPAMVRPWVVFKPPPQTRTGPSAMCFKNRQRERTLLRPTATPTATSWNERRWISGYPDTGVLKRTLFLTFRFCVTGQAADSDVRPQHIWRCRVPIFQRHGRHRTARLVFAVHGESH